MGELERHLLGSVTTRKVEKVTPSQDDDFVGVLKKNIPNKLALMGVYPWVGPGGPTMAENNSPRVQGLETRDAGPECTPLALAHFNLSILRVTHHQNKAAAGIRADLLDPL